MKQEDDDMTWSIVKCGKSLKKYQVYWILDIIKNQVSSQPYSKACKNICGRAEAEFGEGAWNAIITNGKIGRITYASQQFYLVVERKDGITAYCWMTKILKQIELQKSIVRESIYF